METFDEIEQQVRSIIAEELQIDEQNIHKSSTIEDLGGDSLKALMIISALEARFDINISDEDAVKIKSFPSIIEVVRRLTGK
ncbi:MAG: phosphopantetheine-binding protein [Thermodesulfovibrionales bacterium]|nr:phosphopantetheine-binding protein [Thermodesulfovibrionales bacterium]